MANPWFRCYAEMVNDPKVQMLPEVMRWRWVAILCLRCDETLETLHDRHIAFRLRISESELAETKALFIDSGFIDEHWEIENWKRRQYVSDSSTERVRKFREKKKESASESINTQEGTNRNVPVTAPDTEQIQNQKTEQTTFALTATAVPTASVFDLPLPGQQGDWGLGQALYDEMIIAYPGVSVMEELGKMRAWLITNASQRKTVKGMPKFINNWLSRAQDKAPRGGSNGNQNRGTFSQHLQR